MLSLIYHATIQTIVLAQVWSCRGTKIGNMGGDQLLQISQTRASPSPGSLASVEILCSCTLVDVSAFSCSELYVVALVIAWAQESAQNLVAQGLVSLVLVSDSRCTL